MYRVINEVRAKELIQRPIDYIYNPDFDDESNPLPPVKRLVDAIKAADALLIVTPEYNHSIPAVTKNVLDWASRFDGVLEEKLEEIAHAVEQQAAGMRRFDAGILRHHRRRCLGCRAPGIDSERA